MHSIILKNRPSKRFVHFDKKALILNDRKIKFIILEHFFHYGSAIEIKIFIHDHLRSEIFETGLTMLSLIKGLEDQTLEFVCNTVNTVYF